MTSAAKEQLTPMEAAITAASEFIELSHQFGIDVVIVLRRKDGFATVLHGVPAHDASRLLRLARASVDETANEAQP